MSAPLPASPSPLTSMPLLQRSQGGRSLRSGGFGSRPLSSPMGTLAASPGDQVYFSGKTTTAETDTEKPDSSTSPSKAASPKRRRLLGTTLGGVAGLALGALGFLIPGAFLVTLPAGLLLGMLLGFLLAPKSQEATPNDTKPAESNPSNPQVFGPPIPPQPQKIITGWLSILPMGKIDVANPAPTLEAPEADNTREQLLGKEMDELLQKLESHPTHGTIFDAPVQDPTTLHPWGTQPGEEQWETTWYHGTEPEFADKIRTNDFNFQLGERMECGNGVYLANLKGARKFGPDQVKVAVNLPSDKIGVVDLPQFFNTVVANTLFPTVDTFLKELVAANHLDQDAAQDCAFRLKNNVLRQYFLTQGYKAMIVHGSPRSGLQEYLIALTPDAYTIQAHHRP